MNSSSNSVPFALESCSMVSVSRILLTGKSQKSTYWKKRWQAMHGVPSVRAVVGAKGVYKK